jgi:molybdopterin converting factor small subunit
MLEILKELEDKYLPKKEEPEKVIPTRADFGIPSLPDYNFYQKINEACQAKENSPAVLALLTEIKEAWGGAIVKFNLGQYSVDDLEDLYLELKFKIDERIGQLNLQKRAGNQELNEHNYFLDDDWDVFVDRNWEIATAQSQITKDLTDLERLVQDLTKKIRSL